LRTVSEALAKAACQLLDIEPGEIMAEYRPALTKDSAGRDGLQAEIFLYDTLPGGAGFSTQAARLGVALFKRASELLKGCPEQCDSSCYRCLRSFKNKIEHHLLDRHVGSELVEYLLSGKIPEFNAERVAASAHLLMTDLQRQYSDGIQFERDVKVTLASGDEVSIPILCRAANGRALAIFISAPLTEDTVDEEATANRVADELGMSVVSVNELLVRENLPAATTEVQSEIKRL